jgi:hypothetical protein
MISDSAFNVATSQRQGDVPLRSPRTSIVLAERTRQRRRKRHRRRQARTRWAARFAIFDRRPFDLICQRTAPYLVFAGTMPLVYALRPW